MPFFSLFSAHSKNALLIDIGNGSVSGAFVSIPENTSHSPLAETKPAILFSARVPFAFDNKPNSARLVQSIHLAVETLCEKIIQNLTSPRLKGKNKKISDIVISLAAPWYTAKVKNIHVENDRTFVITETFIKDILEKEAIIFSSEVLGSASVGQEKSPLANLEHIILDAEINGYSMKQCIGKKANVFDLHAYLSLVDTELMEKVGNTFLKHFRVSKRHLSFHTYPFVSYSAIRSMFPATEDFIIMDVTSELSDIIVVKGGLIHSFASFPCGRNFILREIGKRFDTTGPLAESMLRMYSEQKMDAELLAQMDRALVEAEKEWSKYLEDVLASLAGDTLPPIMYITAENDIAGVIMAFLKIEKLDSTMPWRASADLKYIGREALSSFYRADTPLPVDEYVALLSVFYKSLFNTNKLA